MPRVSELPLASSGPLNGDELVIIDQGGVTVQTTVREVADAASGSVISVNGASGVVVLAAADVLATPDPTVLPNVSGLLGTELVAVDQGGTFVQATVQQIADLVTTKGLGGINFTSDTSSTADSDPGGGGLRWNNATQASATVLYIDDTSSDAASLAALWPALGNQGLLLIQQANNEANWQFWKWTAHVDGTGYRKFTVSMLAHGNSIGNSKNVHLLFMDTGTPDPSTLRASSGLTGEETLVVEEGNIPQQATVQQIADLATAAASPVGRHAVYIAAASIKPSNASGCAALANIASSAGDPDINTLDFDSSSAEYAQFSIAMPKSWNEGTVTFKPHWSHASTTTNFGVVWKLEAVALSDGDAIATAFGTGQTSTDTGGTTNTKYTGPESSAITVAGTPAAEDMVFFRISRVPTDGSDTMAIDARLHGVTVYITTDAANDA